MAKDTKICRVCGKQYKACRTEIKGVFRWQDVACCPEHGLEYFRRIELSRAEKPSEDDSVKEVATEICDTEDLTDIIDVDEDVSEEDDEYICGTDEEDIDEE